LFLYFFLIYVYVYGAWLSPTLGTHTLRRENVIDSLLHNKSTSCLTGLFSAVENLDLICIPPCGVSLITVWICVFSIWQTSFSIYKYINVEKSRNPESFVRYSYKYRDWVMVLNVSNALDISWWSVLLLKETGLPEENH
jgi:hypothetical protein